MIYHLDVEQGDGALIVSPGGQTVMIDSGRVNCAGTVAYVQARTATLDYFFATHYDADHISCTDNLVDAGVTITHACYDRGGSHDTQTFDDYVAACGAKRQAAFKGQRVTLDSGSTRPVYIDVVDLNGAGVTTSDENALGLVLLVSYGDFQHVFAGDLPGQSPDIESVVGPEVGDVDVCKVNHHGSKYSSTDNWLDAIDAEVCVLSVGNNGYGHPTTEALGRLHAHGVKLYWTNVGSGASPNPPQDVVVDGAVVIEVSAQTYRVGGEEFVIQ